MLKKIKFWWNLYKFHQNPNKFYKSPRGKTMLSKWSKLVRKNQSCKKCKSTKNLEAHHMYPKSKYPSLAFNVDNGITLCKSCHVTYHQKYTASYSTLLTFLALG